MHSKVKLKESIEVLLKNNNINYEVTHMEVDGGFKDGVDIANRLGKNPIIVYKTLIMKGKKSRYTIILPVDSKLDIKKIKQEMNEPKLSFIDLKEFTEEVIKGGCSPLEFYDGYNVILDNKALNYEEIIINGGGVGLQIHINPLNLIEVINAKVLEVSL